MVNPKSVFSFQGFPIKLFFLEIALFLDKKGTKIKKIPSNAST